MNKKHSRAIWNNIQSRLNDFNIAALSYIQGFPLEWETDLQKIDFTKIPYTFPDVGKMEIKYIKLRHLIIAINNYNWVSEINTSRFIDELTTDRKYIEIIRFLGDNGKLAPPLLQIYYLDNGLGECVPIGANLLDGSRRAKLAVWNAGNLEDTIPVIVTTITNKQDYPIIKAIELECISRRNSRKDIK